MRKRARVYDDTIHPISPCIVDSIDDSTFMVRLIVRDPETQYWRSFAQRRFDLRKGRGAIDSRLTCAEEVQVWPVDEEDLLLLGSSHCEVMERDPVALEEFAEEVE